MTVIDITSTTRRNDHAGDVKRRIDTVIDAQRAMR
jgi:hypothetical protein